MNTKKESDPPPMTPLFLTVAAPPQEFDESMEVWLRFSLRLLDLVTVEVKLNDEKDLLHQDKQRICQDMKTFLKPLREKLLEFEAELKER